MSNAVTPQDPQLALQRESEFDHRVLKIVLEAGYLLFAIFIVAMVLI